MSAEETPAGPLTDRAGNELPDVVGEVAGPLPGDQDDRCWKATGLKGGNVLLVGQRGTPPLRPNETVYVVPESALEFERRIVRSMYPRTDAGC